MSAHLDRRRAGAFGSAAEEYDRYRPRYPQGLVDSLVSTSRRDRVLDVGAGTGIASVQFRDRGAQVLAVEPDPAMAKVAATKGIPVEVATFENWKAAGRQFDLVVFAQSFHWVDPQIALGKISSILTRRGRFVLLSNRITPVSPTRQELDAAYTGYLGTCERPAIDAVYDGTLMTLIRQQGYTIKRRIVTETLHYTAEAWANMVTTYSSVLTLTPEARSGLRSSLLAFIGAAGVEAENTATAILGELAERPAEPQNDTGQRDTK
ncbi:bifunctional 2-polyprenyl-6-hydroxyphenol methylase/3-demethylubiquinol 3-O-methyltransferase UbiG [Mycolicibacterium sp. YH-1]|uniref:class I SAM-dependent methyltransferase n=1 Tax=Mycolicibacterium sp. YH-1 TaxID=2908837 RepID=UPI001F4BDF79|nr:class I SAM-dependent methyltransferase [Mycolicibacterium sp. YH-1]UNB52982.1 methyltransferase domain-containing protein [Mycolicibacterium sp. YH-1]